MKRFEFTHDTCISCGKVFERKRGQRNNRPHACSQVCAARNARATDGSGPVTKHGHTVGVASRTYVSWSMMLNRCDNQKDPTYRWYGARGITVCDRWRAFESFLADMGERPEGRTLNRLNNDGNYEPGNCNWATASEQTANRRPYQKKLKPHANP